MGNIRYKGDNYTKATGGAPTPPAPVKQNVEFADIETFNFFDNIKKLSIPEGVKTITDKAGAPTIVFDKFKVIEFPSTLEEFDGLSLSRTTIEKVIFNGGTQNISGGTTYVALKYLILNGGTPGDVYKIANGSNSVMFISDDVFDLFYNAYEDGSTYHFGMERKGKLGIHEEYEWDFTGANPEYDKSGRYRLTGNNVTFSNEGANFSASDSYLKLPQIIDPTYNAPIGYEFEINVGEITGGMRLITQSFNFGAAGDAANMVAFWDGHWDMWTQRSNQTELTSISDFDNKNVTFKFLFPGAASMQYPYREIELYSNDDKLKETMKGVPTPRGTGAFSIGSHRNACQMIIKGFKLKLSWE